MPETNHLKAIRQEIDYNAHDLKKTIDDPEFINLFGEFRKQDQLKTVPRDYDADNENIELLKLKSFVAFHHLKRRGTIAKNAVNDIANYMQ